MIREFPARIQIPALSINDVEYRQHLDINNRSKRVAFAHQKHDEELTVNEIALLLHSSTKTVQKYLKFEPAEIEDRIIIKEKQHLLALQQKQQEVENARMLAKSGVPIEEISKEMHHTFKTIQNYLSPDYSVENGHYNVRIPGKLAPYEAEVIKLRSDGMTYPIIADLYASVKELYEIIYSKHSDRLDAWLSRLEDYNIPELQTYVKWN